MQRAPISLISVFVGENNEHDAKNRTTGEMRSNISLLIMGDLHRLLHPYLKYPALGCLFDLENVSVERHCVALREHFT